MTRNLSCAALALTFVLAVPAIGRDSDPRQRKAILIDFAAAPADRARSGWHDDGPVMAEMLADFGSAEARLPIGDRTRDRIDTGFVRSPVRVPGWMRQEAGMLPIQAIPGPLPAIGACGPRNYSTSGLLKAAGEERRRVLYPLVVQTACRYGIPVGLFDAMIMQESRYSVVARSPKGAFGLGQLMPGTAAQLGVDRYDIHGNLDGAARYLSGHLREFNQPALALAAYNAGPGRVRGALRVPRIAETQEYVRQIMLNWRALEWRASARQ